MKALEGFRALAEGLSEKGCTLNVSYQGKPVLRVGKEAKPGLLALLGPIEVRDLVTLLKLLG